MKTVLLQGNEACARGAIAAGCRFFAGYPITPSSEIVEVMAKELPRVGGAFIQMEDEIASIAACLGASLAGVKALTATSGPGFSLKQENIGYAAMAEIPVVVVNVQRFGPSTGMPTAPAQGDFYQARWGTHGDHPVVVLAPWSVEETYRLTIRAFNLAEVYRLPVILLLDEGVAHLRERVELPEAGELAVWERPKPEESSDAYDPAAYATEEVPPMPPLGAGYRLRVTGLVHGPDGFPSESQETVARLLRRLCGKVEGKPELLQKEEEGTDDASVLVVAYGSTARGAAAAVRAARERGWPVAMFRPVTVWPFPEARIGELAAKVREILVPELSLGQLSREVERAAGRKVRSMTRVDGSHWSPGEILAAIEEAGGWN